MSSDYLECISQSAIQELTCLSIDKQAIESLRKMRASSDESVTTDLTIIRITLENVCKSIAAFAHNFEGVQFSGDWTSFGQIRDFLKNTGWLTEAENRFVASYYGILSDAGSHGGQSELPAIQAVYMCWFVVDLLVRRIKNPKKHRRAVSVRSSVDDYKIASQFISLLRQGKWKGRAFEINFDRDMMQMARELLRKNDVTSLLSLMKTNDVRPALRNRAASLLLSKNIIKDKEQKSFITHEMNRFYWENLETAPWQVLRAIALALANRLNNHNCIFDYITRIKASEHSADQNFEVTDTYYGTRSKAIDYCLHRLNNPEVPIAGCLWEIFYLSRRAEKGSKAVIKVIERCKRRTEDKTLKNFCEEALMQLNMNSA